MSVDRDGPRSNPFHPTEMACPCIFGDEAKCWCRKPRRIVVCGLPETQHSHWLRKRFLEGSGTVDESDFTEQWYPEPGVAYPFNPLNGIPTK